MGFTTSDKGIQFLIKEEGLKLKAYKLKGEKYFTIGVGHYGADVYEGMEITREQAINLLKKDLERFENYVNKNVTNIELNQSSFNALISYVFNRGLGKSDGSSGLMQLVKNSNSIVEYYKNFPIYWGSAKNYKDALISRRKREAAIFISEYNNEDKPIDNTSFKVKVTAKVLNIRNGAGASCAQIGSIRDKGVYTIVKTQGNWGYLKSGAGWICLDYTTKLW